MSTRRERCAREDQLRNRLGNQLVLENGFRRAKDKWLPTGARWPGPSFLHPRETFRTLFKPVATTAGQSAYLALKESPLLLAVLFLAFLTSEAWQFFARLDLTQFLEVIAAFLLLSLIVFLFGLRRPWKATYRILESGHKDHDKDVEENTRDFDSELVRHLQDAGVNGPSEPVAVPRRSRGMVGLVEVLRLFFLAVVVGSVVALFFIALGALAVDDSLTRAWTARSGDSVVYNPSDFDIPLLGTVPGVTQELVQVSLALGAFAVLNFAVRVATDPRTRTEAVDQRFAGYAVAIRTWAHLYHGEMAPSERPDAAP